MELYGFMEREKKIPSYFFIITKALRKAYTHLTEEPKLTPFLSFS